MRKLLRVSALAAMAVGLVMLGVVLLGDIAIGHDPLRKDVRILAETLDASRFNGDAYAARPRHEKELETMLDLPLTQGLIRVRRASKVLSAISVHNGGTAIGLVCCDGGPCRENHWNCDTPMKFITGPVDFIDGLASANDGGAAELNSFLAAAATAPHWSESATSSEYRSVRVYFTSRRGGWADILFFWGGIFVFLAGALAVICDVGDRKRTGRDTDTGSAAGRDPKTGEWEHAH